MNQKLELMGHVVAGYPDIRSCICAATGILRGGAKYLEVQFPFSDGNADGTLIQSASDYSLRHGFVPQHGFTIINALMKNTSKHILAMTYANIVLQYGVKEFVRDLVKHGAYGVIIPDLGFGGEDFGMRDLCKEHGIYFIELIAPLTPQKRIREIANQTFAPFLYVVARNGITGNQTLINREVLEYIEDVVEICMLEGKSVMVGFGINHASQLALLQHKVHGVVAGSYFVDIINKNQDSGNLMEILQNSTRDLLGIRNYKQFLLSI
ncbi:tryptophan synthase subunit alpha [Helicobacter trogontum]|uniref:tryptophan synthase n=1 Tax=Helicobacter trogontum TaxID=50960 RepID=A0A4U8TDG8_9HELI|nr:tryptophan synthase subunit alpha [Helicobacter trogontum]TLD98050.1 tryptophan synthase subunit alpha [Helicobacter trogontum]